jgi:predicted Zn-dependent protease
MDIEALENMLDQMLQVGRDSALLRMGLASALQQHGQPQAALAHLQSAVKQDPDLSAAWKILGKLHLELGDQESARQAWQQGVLVAEALGDKQALKEMQVFLKRLDRNP